MYETDPKIELIENPLSLPLVDPESTALLPNNNGRRKGAAAGQVPQSGPIIRTNKDYGPSPIKLSSSQSHHLIGQEAEKDAVGLLERKPYSTSHLPSESSTTINLNLNPMSCNSSNNIIGGTGCNASQVPKTLQVHLDDEGYCLSINSSSQPDNQDGEVGIRKVSSASPYPHDSPNGSHGSQDADRETWGQSLDFLLSIIGFAVDLANVWRFPYYCYKNGGGAFLIPYFLMLAFSAIPVFYMELLLGQSIRQGPISMWKICPLFKGIGYCAVTVSYFVSSYYNTIMGWSLHYTIHSFSSPLPWTTCNNSWNTDHCYIDIPDEENLLIANYTIDDSQEILDEELLQRSTRPSDATSPASEYFRNSVLEMGNHNIDNLGSPKIDLLICVAVIYCLLYLILFRGIRSTGKVVWVTATLPYGVLAILLVRGLMLEGATDGIYYYLVPNMTKLREVEVWSDAAKQIFFSSGAGFGVHLTYASYNNFHNNCYRDCIVTSLVNCFTSIFSGFVIFTFLGSMAKRQKRHINEVVNIGPGLVFEVYPEAVGTLPGANFWSLLFFIMLIMLGIDSAMGGLECVITGITDEFKVWFRGKKHTKEWFKLGIVFVSFLISIINITRGGMYTFTFLDAYAAGSSLLLAVLFEVLAVSWVYGLDQLCKDAEAMLGSPPGIFWRICWKFISPLLIAIIIILDFSTHAPLTYDEYTFPEWAQLFGVIFTFIPITLVPIIGLTEFCKFPGNCKSKLSYSITPTNEHATIKERGIVKRFHWKHWLFMK